MTPQSGIVDSISLDVGRADLLTLAFREDNKWTWRMFSLSDQSEVTFDGQKVDIDSFFRRFLTAQGEVHATLYPLAERYGLALKSEWMVGPYSATTAKEGSRGND